MSDLLSQLREMEVVDLTHSLSAGIPAWDGSRAFGVDEDRITMLTSSGTHVDAPAHFFGDGMTIDQIPFNQLFGPACVIDVSGKADADYQITPADIEQYERDYGLIAEGSIVVGLTGWGRHWANPKDYRNADGKGRTHFPTFSLSAVQVLVERKIAGVGIDTLALESLDSSFPGHQVLLGAGKYIIENLANASRLPCRGAYILVFPLKIGGGGEAPARVIGLMLRGALKC